MIGSFVEKLGPWTWWMAGFILLGLEIIVPGIFLLWIGLAAVAVGILSLLLWESPFWLWQVQALMFAAFSVASILIGRRLVGTHRPSDEPHLNDRGASLVGRTATLAEPILEGKGRIRLDDTFWQVMGPDLPVGTRVKIVSAHGRDLRVEPT